MVQLLKIEGDAVIQLCRLRMGRSAISSLGLSTFVRARPRDRLRGSHGSLMRSFFEFWTPRGV